MEWRRRSP